MLQAAKSSYAFSARQDVALYVRQRCLTPRGFGGLVRAGAGVREVSAILSGNQSNPAGLAAGSRWSLRGRRGNDHRTREPKVLASRRDARTAHAQPKTSPFPRKTEARPGNAPPPILGVGPWVRFAPITP
jgi:hypothetical protein